MTGTAGYCQAYKTGRASMQKKTFHHKIPNKKGFLYNCMQKRLSYSSTHGLDGKLFILEFLKLKLDKFSTESYERNF